MSRDFTQAEGTELRLRKVLSAMTAVNSLRHSPRLRQAATTVASVLAALACLCGFTFSAAAPPAVADPCGSQCGGGGNGGPDSGGGSQFQPPGMPSVPPNAANHGYYPAPDQANGISIYNPTPGRPGAQAQTSPAAPAPQSGTAMATANGTQPPAYPDSAQITQLSSDWQSAAKDARVQTDWCLVCGAPHGGMYSPDYCYQCVEKGLTPVQPVVPD